LHVQSQLLATVHVISGSPFLSWRFLCRSLLVLSFSRFFLLSLRSYAHGLGLQLSGLFSSPEQFSRWPFTFAISRKNQRRPPLAAPRRPTNASGRRGPLLYLVPSALPFCVAGHAAEARGRWRHGDRYVRDVKRRPAHPRDI